MPRVSKRAARLGLLRTGDALLRDLSLNALPASSIEGEQAMRSWNPTSALVVSRSVVGALLVVSTLSSGPAQAAAPEACSALSNLTFPDVTSITAASVPANTFQPPPVFPGLPPPAPVPVPFCRVLITVHPQINIEVWLPSPESWN